MRTVSCLEFRRLLRQPQPKVYDVKDIHFLSENWQYLFFITGNVLSGISETCIRKMSVASSAFKKSWKVGHTAGSLRRMQVFCHFL